jgi:hypothetical protein
MRELCDNEALNREYEQLLSVTAAVYLGGGLLFLLAVPLILRFECRFECLTKLGWIEFFLWLIALLYSAHCAKSGKGVFRLLCQWEQSLLRRKRNLEASAADRTVKKPGRVLVTKIANGNSNGFKSTSYVRKSWNLCGNQSENQLLSR